jgi:hypothetical protein
LSFSGLVCGFVAFKSPKKPRFKVKVSDLDLGFNHQFMPHMGLGEEDYLLPTLLH